MNGVIKALIEQCAQSGKRLVETVEGVVSAARELGVVAFEDGTRNAPRCGNCAHWDGTGCSEGLGPTDGGDWCISWCARETLPQVYDDEEAHG